MFNSLFKFVENVAEVVITPVEIAAQMANTVIKPVVEGLKEIKEEFEDPSKYP